MCAYQCMFIIARCVHVRETESMNVWLSMQKCVCVCERECVNGCLCVCVCVRLEVCCPAAAKCLLPFAQQREQLPAVCPRGAG